MLETVMDNGPVGVVVLLGREKRERGVRGR